MSQGILDFLAGVSLFVALSFAVVGVFCVASVIIKETFK